MVRTLEADLRAVRSDTGRLRARFVQTVREIAHALRPRVLIADDNFAYARLLSQALDRRGIAADVALDEGQVRFALVRTTYDLVVVDGDCGREACEGIRTLIVSGQGDNARVDVSKAAGIGPIADRINAEIDEIAARLR